MTSSLPGAGSEKRAGCAFSTPTTSRMLSSTARPGGLSRPATTTSAIAIAASGFQERRRGCGSRSANALAHDGERAHARLVLVRDLDLLELALSHRFLQRVEPSAEARVDRPAREAEQF